MSTTTERATDVPTHVTPIKWEDFGGDATTATTLRSLAATAGSIRLRIELGHARIPRGELDDLRSGSVVPLDNSVCDSVVIRADGRLIARGELLAIDGRFGVRIVEFIAPAGDE